ncbi:uncharacterized protein LOC120260391 [Dioscorea cayenensis subsp. rotundata]|uniref:Uncharacterized protein LOC120260391 n=1 Tax=Dioscorea cayennensis subsp. rotundata TaxID=55577 RepID=A0AB40B958_DIOCR|nr:uncharacterized protein LOC120260391 [Dioscorea cayenensis subsp. rotundata]
MEDALSAKRGREETDESFESPEPKRLRESLFLDIFEDDGDSGERDPAIQDLATVMKSLEEEIGLPSTVPPPKSLSPVVEVDPGQPDLGFLLEASDDELGLPPTVLSSSEDGGEVDAAAETAVAEEDRGFGAQIWGFDDEIFDNGLAFGGGRMEDEDAVWYDGGLFDYSDEQSRPSDLPDVSWRSESLPAV